MNGPLRVLILQLGAIQVGPTKQLTTIAKFQAFEIHQQGKQERGQTRKVFSKNRGLKLLGAKQHFCRMCQWRFFTILRNSFDAANLNTFFFP